MRSETDDERIVGLFWARSEDAVSATQQKYGSYCRSIAYRILHNWQDAEECESDTYLKAWHAIPPNRPKCLKTFLAKITRNIALDRYEHNTADRRGGGQTALILEELAECLPDGDSLPLSDDFALRDALDRFLGSLPTESRNIFMERYWFMHTVQDIAAMCGASESRVKVTLFRTRQKLRVFLEKEGIDV